MNNFVKFNELLFKILQFNGISKIPNQAKKFKFFTNYCFRVKIYFRFVEFFILL